MRITFAVATTLLLAGCGGDEPKMPPLPQPDSSLAVGDEGILKYGGVICNSVELYELGASSGDISAFDTVARAIDNGDCTPTDTENLAYKVVAI